MSGRVPAVGPLLDVADLTVRYGPVAAVREATLHVDEGEVIALVGPNGAGKTTLLHAIVGLVPAAAGSVALRGVAITGQAPETIVRRGLALVPEHRRIFGGLTVEPNLRLGTVARRTADGVEARVAELLALFGVLAERRDQLAGTLSGGEAQQLALARALVGDPDVLLLDEPSLGLAPRIVDDVFGHIAGLRDQGLTIVLVEQHAERAIALADRVYVMASGRLSGGEPATEHTAARVRTGYLGG